MYYAYDRHTIELPAKLESTMAACAEKHPETHFYALVDSAFAPEEVSALLAGTTSLQAISIYLDTPLQDFEELSPILVQFPQDKAERQTVIAQWLALCNGKPMLSFVSSALDIANLKQHFSAFLRLRDNHNQRYVLRFADVCMTADILECVQPEQKQAWLNGMHAWWLIGRDGGLQYLGGVEATPVIAKSNENHDQRISNAQLLMLHQKNEADCLLSYLHESVPKLFTKHQPSVLYRRTAELLQQLNQQHVHDDSTRLEHVVTLLAA